MSKRRSRTLALCILASVSACSAQIMPKNMDEEQLRAMRAQLGEGKTFQSVAPVSGTDLRHARIYGVVDAPVDRVWAVITDYNYYSEFIPLVLTSKVRFIQGNMAKAEFFFGLPGVPLTYRVVLAGMHYPEVRRVEWVYVEGDIRDTFGSWTLRPYGENRTEVVFSMFLDLGGTIVAPLTQPGSSLALPRFIEALRSRVKAPRYDSFESADFTKPIPRKPSLVDQQFADFN